MEEKDLNINKLTFGKYKNKELKDLLKDRKYCEWLLLQDWFKKNYEFLYNRIKEYNPSLFFIKTKNKENKKESNESKLENIIKNYKYFNLIPITELKIELNEEEKICYNFYLSLIEEIKEKIIYNENNNPFDIKAPKSWLLTFERKYGISREIFKNFLSSYDLPNITKIIEDLKSFGGIDYKGNKSFKIAKENSLKQEKYWEKILKDKYGENISSQFKFNNCIFDFINISKNTLYECKLSLKDFNENQFIKYKTALVCYKMIYLISDDCIINIENGKIFTLNTEKYKRKIAKILEKGTQNNFENLLVLFEIIKIDNLKNFI